MKTMQQGMVAGVLLMATLLAHGQTDEMPKDRFTDMLAGILRKHLPGQPVEVAEPLQLVMGGLPVRLDRPYRSCARSPTSCRETLATFLFSVVAGQTLCQQPVRKEAVGVVMRTQAQLQSLDRLAGGQGEGHPYQARPVAGDLHAVLVHVGSEGVCVFPALENAKLGLTAEELFSMAGRNLEGHLTPLSEMIKKPGDANDVPIGMLATGPYETGRLDQPQVWADMAKANGGVLIVAAPDAGTVYFTGSDTALSLDVLRTIAAGDFAEGPRPLTRQLMRWTPQGWVVVPEPQAQAVEAAAPVSPQADRQ